MRILQINTTVNSGSTGRIAEDIGKVLTQHGHESSIAFGRGDRPSQSQKIRIGSKWDIYYHGLQTMLFDKHGLASQKATKNLITTIESLKPDMLGLHNLHGYYLNYPILFNYIKAIQLPVVWTFHDCWPFTGHCAYFDSVNCTKWKTHCQQCPLTGNYPKAWVDRSFQNFDEKKEAFLGVKNLTIVTPSQWLANLVKQSFLKEYPTQVIHNGIDLEVFTPLEGAYNPEEKTILGVASTWDARKGLSDFIALRKILPEKYKIILIGLHSKQIETLPSGIQGIARTENIQELVKYYNQATVFVNPTYVDNFPTTNIEALACGTPVITYNTGGSPEAIDELTGYTVEKGNVQALAEAIQKIEKTPQQIEHCRNRALNRFDSLARYKDYLHLYQNIFN